ncbi:hypothetical protein GGR51DRAFT_169643 [Nemania sp. FL0031]|nr:hypothetical protein GGR51DRAFT_169643 [Nemania sp. FL0031]
MPNPTIIEAHETGAFIDNLAGRSVAPAATLSVGAIAGIAVAGSMLLFILLIGPLLVHLAKRQERQRAASCPVSSLAFVENGQLANEDDLNIPRRLRKKSTASEPPMYLGMGDVESEVSEGGRGGRPKATRHLSLPILPPVFSRAKSLRFGDTYTGGSRKGRRSPEKHRGYNIYQNRRKTSWIDEDALHGPRISPKKKSAKGSKWFTGNGLTRTLSRHFSFRGYRAPELARSPTLPYTETAKGQEFVGKPLAKSSEAQVVDNTRRMRDFQAEIEIEPRFPVRQPTHQGGSMNVQVINTGSQGFPIPIAPLPYPQPNNEEAISAAEKLAGRARVPYLDMGANVQRQPGVQESNTDAELQAILRRTAERLQDGNRSARRQTLMIPTSASASRLQDRFRRGSDQECGCGRDHGPPGELPPSPAKSQKSAPGELEGYGPGFRQSVSQNGASWQTQRPAHTRQMSHISQISVLSEPDSLVATPSRRGSQADGIQTALSSPSRMAQTSPSYPQHVLIQRSYTPVSDQSSALSTVYSEEEEGTPSILKLDDDDVLKDEREAERTAIAQALPPQTHDDTQSPRSRHMRTGTMGQISPNRNQTTLSPRQSGIKYLPAMPSPKAISRYTLEALQRSVATDDPFTTTCTTPKQTTPPRLSQVFSPIPREAPIATKTPSASAEPTPGSPTPSPSRRRIMPPPHQLQLDSNSPTLGHYHDAQLQSQPEMQPPSREPSPAASESGLSSVYDSYRYSRYSDTFEGSAAALARLSTGTVLTVPPTGGSPTKSSSSARWNEEVSPSASTQSRMSGPEMESTSAATTVSEYGPRVVSPMMPSSVETATVEDMRRRRYHGQAIRDVSLGGASIVSESVYSQDEDGEDRLAPLVALHPTATTRRAMRLASGVADLRRMNSQISCISGYSVATTIASLNDGENITSPTLPPLPALPASITISRKRAAGGSRNYLSLGGALANSVSEEGRTGPVGETSKVNITKGEVAVPRARSRRHTVVESFEQDLNRARQNLRGNRGHSVQGIPGISNKGLEPGGLMIQTAK